jgi:2-C-methyl-D-erythritol 4-phosphate cytidylyltransferase/2-C-methyl-D-erythritol 2,4-cyclodiphosphate synthase
MSETPRIFALIVAAGTGSRAGGGVPKQYQTLAGQPMLRYSLAALARHPAILGVQVVIHPEHAAHYEAVTAPFTIHDSRFTTLLPPIHGGAERADSVRAGLAALAAHAPDYVFIHDAARPFLSQAMITALCRGLSLTEAVLPALAVADTVRRFEGGTWHEVSRKSLMRMQTPQVFPFGALARLMGASPPNPLPAGSLTLRMPDVAVTKNPTDEAAVWLAARAALRYVEGHEELRKVTTPEDIAWADAHARGMRRTAIGMGYDVHALMPSGDAGVIRLGGIDIPSAHKLHGHSDADVVLHAIVDALLGSIAAGDIGSFFPPSEAKWKGANSAIFVREARAQVAVRGGIIQHLDITIIGEQPKISPHRDAMRDAIAGMLNLPLSHVSVKATTTEKLGFTGREEGIACHAVATVMLPMEAA